MNDKIGILMPCYNTQDYIQTAYYSLFIQDVNKVMYFLDDASTDNSGKIITDFATQDKNVYVYRNERNMGWVSSYNRLGRWAITEKCDYLFIMASDDWLEPHALPTMLEALKSTDSDFCVCWGKNSENGLMKSEISPKLEDFKTTNRIANFPLIKASMWEELGGYDTDFKFYADWEFWIRALKAGKTHCVVEEPLYNYRFHADQTHRKANHQEEVNKLLQKHYV